MKKIIICLIVLCAVSGRAEIIPVDETNEVFIDEEGFYRYKRAEETYQQNCKDASTEEVRSKCMAAEKAVWERGKTKEEIQKQGTLFTGKIRVHSDGKEIYFYIDEGEKGKQIQLLFNRYYFENGLLYDIQTETPVSDTIVVGGVEGLSADENAPRYLALQKYEDGQAVGEPQLVLVESE